MVIIYTLIFWPYNFYRYTIITYIGSLYSESKQNSCKKTSELCSFLINIKYYIKTLVFKTIK